MNIIDRLEAGMLRTDLPKIAPGDTVKVHVKVKEGEKERIQVYQGVVISIRGGGMRTSFTVRKISVGVGVERVFPLHSPSIDHLEVLRSGKVRRAKLYFLREKLGKAYSPGASSQTSRVYKGYGTFAVSASVDVKDLGLTRAEIAASIAGLRDHPVSDDLLLRARAPLVQGIDNALKTNGSWLGLVARAQIQPDRIDRLTKAKARMLAITPAQLQATARRYLADAAMVDVAALPDVSAQTAQTVPPAPKL